MSVKKNLQNLKFHKLLVLEESPKYQRKTIWKCLCECGNIINVRQQSLLSGHTKSCGCLYSPNKNLIKQSFGYLTVLKLVPSPKEEKLKHKWWECLCKCGNYCIVKGSDLRSKNTQSCGCLWKEKIREANLLPLGESAKRRIFRTYQRMANKRGYEWNLSNEEFLKLTNQNCFYCNASPSNKCKEKGGDFIYNGIDRVDNTKGYSVDNCVSSCFICNGAKKTMSLKEFKEWISRIHVNMKL